MKYLVLAGLLFAAPAATLMQLPSQAALSVAVDALPSTPIASSPARSNLLWTSGAGSSAGASSGTSATLSPARLAQFRIPGLPRIPVDVPVPSLPIPGLDSLTQDDPPITTSLSDVISEIPLMDDSEWSQFTPMTSLPRRDDGAFLSRPGTFELVAQSYCLRAGTHGPGGGEGYGYAPLKGPREAIVTKILQNSVRYPDMSQQQVQMLLWGIIARTKISDMSSEVQAAARQLLSEEEIRSLNGGALGLIPNSVRQRMFANLPQPLRQVLNAEAELRHLLTQTTAPFEQLERVAVLTGAAPIGEGSQEVPPERWSYHPDGYFVRYVPSGYSETRIQVHIPRPTTVERDALGRITAIADAAGNRIETDYDEAIAPLVVPGDSGLQGYMFKTVRFIRPDPTQPGGQQQVEVHQTGWTYVGIPTGTGTVSQHLASPSLVAANKQENRPIAQGQQRPAGWNVSQETQRYQKAVEHAEQIRKMRDRLRCRPSSDADVEGLTNLDHYQEGLKTVVENDKSGQGEWLGNHLELVGDGFRLAICRLNGGCMDDSPNAAPASSDCLPSDPAAQYPPVIQPGGQVAVPGNTSRQRLGMSGRPRR